MVVVAGGTASALVGVIGQRQPIGRRGQTCWSSGNLRHKGHQIWRVCVRVAIHITDPGIVMAARYPACPELLLRVLDGWGVDSELPCSTHSFLRVSRPGSC